MTLPTKNMCSWFVKGVCMHSLAEISLHLHHSEQQASPASWNGEPFCEATGSNCRSGKGGKYWQPPSARRWQKARPRGTSANVLTLLLTLLCGSAVSRAPKNTEHSQTFPSTEIFSKRRKIYAIMKRNSSCTCAPLGLRAPSTTPLCSPRVI